MGSSEESVLADKKYSVYQEWERLLEESKKHNCALPEAPDIVNIYVRHGHFLNLRRWYRRLTMISEKHPNVKVYFKSRAAVKQEMLKHVKLHYYTFHPMSMATTYWRFFMMLNLIVIWIVIPAIITTRMDFLRPFKFFLDLLFLTDTVVHFNTGYEVYNRKEVVMAKKAIRRNYIFGYCLLDLFSSLPIDYFLYLIGVTGKPLMHIMFLPSFKLLKLHQLTNTMNLLYLWFNIRPFIRKLNRILLLHLLIMWWATCLFAAVITTTPDKSQSWFYKVSPDDESTITVMLWCFFRAAYVCTSVGYGSMASRLVLDHLIDLFCMTVGTGLFVFWMAELLQLLNKSSSTSMRYQELMQQIQEYLNFRELPDAMAKRINNLYEYRYNYKLYREQPIMSTVSPRLKQEVTYDECREIMESIPFFNVLPRAILLKMSVLLKEDTFLANDVVIHAGSPVKEMYFLHSGTTAVYQKDGKELCHLEDKSYFGELSFLATEELVSPGVVAVTPCQFYVLPKKNIIYFREQYPDLYIKLKRLLYQHLERSLAFMEEHEIDVMPPYCLMENCKRRSSYDSD